MEEHRLDLSDSGEGEMAGVCECGNEWSGSIKCRECLVTLKIGGLG